MQGAVSELTAFLFPILIEEEGINWDPTGPALT